MQPSVQFDIHFSHNYLWLLGLTVAVIIFSYLVYKRTNPIVAWGTRVLLLLLRIISLILLLIVIFQVVVILKFYRTEKPILTVLIDTSASMGIRDKTGSRKSAIKQILKSKALEKLKHRFDIKYYTFASEVKPFSPTDSLQFVGDVTDISNAFSSVSNELGEQNLAGFLLLTDGNYNRGGNPVRMVSEVDVPVYTVGIGSAEEIPDLAIVDVKANTFAYAGEATPIEVKIRNTGFDEMKSNLNLKCDGKVIASKIIDLPAAPSETAIRFKYVPDQVGRKKIEIELTPENMERITANNKKSFYIDVLKSRLKILVLSSRVSPEISFLRRYLSQNDRYEVNIFVEKNNGQFYHQKKLLNILNNLHNVDLFIFQNFPGSFTNIKLIEKIKAVLEKNNQPILLLTGKDTNFKMLAPLQAFLPIRSASQQQETLASFVLTPDGQNHQIFLAMNSTVDGNRIWSELPPVFTNHRIIAMWPNSIVLATASTSRVKKEAKKEQPLLVVRTNGSQKSAVLLASGLWRWDMMMLAFGNSENVYEHLLNNLTRWLESKRPTDFVQLETDQSTYNIGDPIKILAKVYDEKFRPISDAKIDLSIRQKTKVFDTMMTPSDNGRYQYTFYPEQPGEYEIKMTATRGQRRIGEASSRIAVGEYSAELANLPMQPALLAKLAHTNGGAFFYPDSISRFGDVVKGKSRRHLKVREVEVWNHPLFLSIIIALLVSEWYLRKRKGMV